MFGKVWEFVKENRTEIVRKLAVAGGALIGLAVATIATKDLADGDPEIERVDDGPAADSSETPAAE